MSGGTSRGRRGRATRAFARHVGGLLVAASIAVAGPAAVTAATHVVSVRSQPDVFDGARLTVAVGDSVTWVVEPGSVHTVTSGTYNASGVHPDGLFDSGSLTPGEEFVYTFTTAGEYPYVCAIHADSGMVGRITVVDSTDPDPVDGGPDVGAAEGPPAAAILALILAALIVVGGGAWFVAGRRG